MYVGYFQQQQLSLILSRSTNTILTTTRSRLHGEAAASYMLDLSKPRSEKLYLSYNKD